MFNAQEYRIPVGPRIERGRSTESLYRLEENAHEALREAGKELGKVLKLENFYKEILPETLLSLLESYDMQASKLAAWVYLQRHPLTKEELEYVEHATI